MQGWVQDESTGVPQMISKTKLCHLNISADSAKSSDHRILFQRVTFRMLKHRLTETWPGSFKGNSI